MVTVNISKVLGVFILLLNLKLALTSPSRHRDIGQGELLNSGHSPSVRGALDTFFDDEDMIIASSRRILDWSERKQPRTVKDTLRVSFQPEPSASERLSQRIRPSKETSPATYRFAQTEADSRDVLAVDSSDLEPFQTDVKASNSTEPSSSINFPGGIRVTKFKRKPIMTYYERLKSGESTSNHSTSENKTESGNPQITVRNHEERVQKVRKKNRFRQKTMKIPTTAASVPTTPVYHISTSYQTERPRFTNTRDQHGADSKRLDSNERKTEHTQASTTSGTTKKPQTRPSRRSTTTFAPQRTSTGRTNAARRGSAKFGDMIVGESGKSSTRVSSAKEEEDKRGKSDAKRVSVRFRNSRAQDIPRLHKPENVTKPESNIANGTKTQEVRRVIEQKKKETGSPKVSSFEVLEDKVTSTGNSEQHHSTHTISSGSTAPPKKSPIKNPSRQWTRNEKRNTSKENVREHQIPRKENSQVYPLESPYYPQGFLSGNQRDENRDENGFFNPQIPYYRNPPPRYGYYFSPHEPKFGPNYALPGFQHSPHVLSLRHSILEGQRDPSTTTTTSEPYSFSIPNFRIPAIDYSHKGCKTLLREVKEVPVGHGDRPNFGGYRGIPRDLYLRRFKREVKSIVMTKECFFPEGVPEEAIQDRKAKIPESSTVPIPVAVVIEKQQNKRRKQGVQGRNPRPIKDVIKGDHLLPRKVKKEREEFPDHIMIAPSEHHVRALQAFIL